jgi:hypothetical protein
MPRVILAAGVPRIVNLHDNAVGVEVGLGDLNLSGGRHVD